MYVNKKKSLCLRFGRRYTEQCAELVTADGGHISWADRCRYLDVYFTRGCSLRCCLEEAKSRFFRAFNAIFSKTGRCTSEPVFLSLLSSKCMPILLYAVEACPLLARQIKSIEFTLTRITVNECQVNFGFLPAKYQILICTAKFLQRFVALESGLCALFASDECGAGSYTSCSYSLGKVFILHVSCAMLFVANF